MFLTWRNCLFLWIFNITASFLCSPYRPTWNINVTRKFNLRNGFTWFSNITDNGPFISWTEFFWSTWNLFGVLFLFFYVIIHWTPWSVDFLGDFSLRTPIFFKSIDQSFHVFCKRLATSHDLFLIFIANLYVKNYLNVKIRELIIIKWDFFQAVALTALLYVCTSKTFEENLDGKLLRNAACSFEPIQEAAPHSICTANWLLYHLIRRIKHSKLC